MKRNEKFIEYATGGFHVHLTPHMCKVLRWVAQSGSTTSKRPEAKEAYDECEVKPCRFVSSCKSLIDRGLVEHHFVYTEDDLDTPSYTLTEEGELVFRLCVRAGILKPVRLKAAA
jgi:predicted methyltransferase